MNFVRRDRRLAAIPVAVPAHLAHDPGTRDRNTTPLDDQLAGIVLRTQSPSDFRRCGLRAAHGVDVPAVSHLDVVRCPSDLGVRVAAVSLVGGHLAIGLE